MCIQLPWQNNLGIIDLVNIRDSLGHEQLFQVGYVFTCVHFSVGWFVSRIKQKLLNQTFGVDIDKCTDPGIFPTIVKKG